jgi:hypothetical protein
MLRVGTPGASSSITVFETLPTLAANVAVDADLIVETTAVNADVVAFAGTVTVAGTATAELVVDRLTFKSLAVGELNATAHAMVPDPVIVAALQDSALSVGVLPALNV